MASERANWLKAYRRKNKKAGWNNPTTVAAYNRWKSSKGKKNNKSALASLPDGWGTDRTDVSGSWKDKPNLNADDWELDQNDDGLWFGRKRTELTGLDPWMKQSVGKWDRDAAARAALTKTAGDQATSAVRAIGEAGAASMTGLAGLINTKMQGNAEASAGSGAQAAAQQLAATQAAASAQRASEAQPGIAQYAMQSLANQQSSSDSAKRQELVNAYRKLKSSEAEAKSEAIAKSYSDQARLIAAAIQSGSNITREQLSQMGQNFRNTQDNEASILNNNVDAAASAGNAGNNAAGKANTARAKKRDDFIKGIKKRIDGEVSSTLGDDGKTSTTVTGRSDSWKQVVNDALAQKIPIGPVLSTLANTQKAKALRGNRNFARWIALKMRSAGIPDATIRTTIIRNLNVDIGPRGGRAGPPSPGRG